MFGVHLPVSHRCATHNPLYLTLCPTLRWPQLRVRVLVRRRDWRVLGFDHRLCADTETWEFGEWKEWAPGWVRGTGGGGTGLGFAGVGAAGGLPVLWCPRGNGNPLRLPCGVPCYTHLPTQKGTRLHRLQGTACLLEASI